MPTLSPQQVTQLLAVCAQAMRHILIDHARAQARDKRGGGAVQVSLEHREPCDANGGAPKPGFTA